MFRVACAAESVSAKRGVGRRSPVGLVLEIAIRQLLPAVVAHDIAGVRFLDGPRRREAANHHHSLTNHQSSKTRHNHGRDVVDSIQPSSASRLGIHSRSEPRTLVIFSRGLWTTPQ